MREINFENSIPPQISELESNLRRIGAKAHEGLSGKYYKIGQEVETGDAYVVRKSGKQSPVEHYKKAEHTHSETDEVKDGVPVRLDLYSFEELDEIHDDEIGSMVM